MSAENPAPQEQPKPMVGGEFDHLLTPGPVPTDEIAPAELPVGKSEIQTRVEQQMGVAAADRANREAAGLPPRVHNLK